MSKGARKRLYLRVQGRVQGVGFRYYAQEHARRLGLDGWVRNERDGSVSVEVEGDETAIRQMEKLLEAGPPAARVAGVAKEWRDAVGTFGGFTVAY